MLHTIRSVGLMLLVFVSVVAAPVATNAESVNLTGTWNLTVNDTEDNCQWTGLMTVNQMGANFTGSIALKLVAGMCSPSTITGSVEGSVSGPGSGFFIGFGIASGEFGQASFEGTVSEDGQSAAGTWTNEASGTWFAQRASQAAPTLSGIALATLCGLLLAAGTLSARRRAGRTSKSS